MANVGNFELNAANENWFKKTKTFTDIYIKNVDNEPHFMSSKTYLDKNRDQILNLIKFNFERQEPVFGISENIMKDITQIDNKTLNAKLCTNKPFIYKTENNQKIQCEIKIKNIEDLIKDINKDINRMFFYNYKTLKFQNLHPITSDSSKNLLIILNNFLNYMFNTKNEFNIYLLDEKINQLECSNCKKENIVCIKKKFKDLKFTEKTITNNENLYLYNETLPALQKSLYNLSVFFQSYMGEITELLMLNPILLQYNIKLSKKTYYFHFDKITKKK